jgi:predicted AAA+ superfamily ATPase
MEIDEALRLLNEWWRTGKVKADLAKGYRRQAFGEGYGLLERYREMVVLTGLRRVGKSTIMYQMIEELLKSAAPSSIVYFTLDYGAVEPVSVLNAYQEISGVNWKRERIWLFLDEIQKMAGWAEQLKLLYDAFPNVRIVVSGSASLQLERGAMDSLAGRYFLVEVPVLSISEYYFLKHGEMPGNVRAHEGEIALEFESYVRRPFPELAKIDDERRISEYIRESVVSKVINEDLGLEFERVDTALLRALADIFLAEPGMTLNVDSLSKTLARRKQEVDRHIYMLEFSKLIRIVRNYRPSRLSESRKLRKVYPYDISLALAENPSIDRGRVLESLLISRLGIGRYWREGAKEVDALLADGRKLIPVEIKSADTFREDFVKGLEYFISRFGAERGILLYNGKEMGVGRVRTANIRRVLIYGLAPILGECAGAKSAGL